MGLVRSALRRAPRADFAGASMNRLVLDWIQSHRSVDQEISGSLVTLRDRARELVRNTSWVRRYVRLLSQNVVGPHGITLQGRLRDPRTGAPLEAANASLEAAWDDFGRRGTFTVDGKLSRRGCERLLMRNLPTDGEILIRLVRGFDNGYGFALQVLDPDQLDQDYNVAQLEGGNEIRMGVEMDRWGRPVAYHVWSSHPSEFVRLRERKRIPAEDMIHLGDPDRPAQTRYVPWLASVMLDINMLRGYFEAELIAARIAASQGGWFTRAADDVGSTETDPEKAKQPIVMEMEPGTWTELPPGLTAEATKAEHPTAAFPDFVKAVLRSVATGLGISYNALANDLEGVNYSSIRAGMLDERDAYRDVQQWFIEGFHERVFEAWLPWALLAGKLDARVPLVRYRDVAWQPRGWSWVDPEKDVDATIKGIDARLTSRSAELAKQGIDFEEVLEEQAKEEALMKAKGLLPVVKPAASPFGAPPAPPAGENGKNRLLADPLALRALGVPDAVSA